MKSFMIAVLSLASVPALAADQNVERSVVSGGRAQIYGYYAINPDCTTIGDVDVKIVDQPAHGTFIVADTQVFPNFNKDNVRSECNSKKVPGLVGTYAATGSYVGDDKLTVRQIDTFGNETIIHYTIHIR
jgi:hypothetical protein